MKLKNFFTSRKYLKKLFIWLSAAIASIVIILSVTVYFTVQQIFMKNEIETSQKVLSQVRFNIEFVDQTIKSISNYMFVNPYISSIINSPTRSDIDINNLYTTLNNVINPTLLSNGYIHSICLYNSNSEQYYYVGKSLFFDDRELKQIINSYPEVPKQKPIFRQIENEYSKTDMYENVITYIMYETGSTPEKIESGIVINVRPEWLLDNIAAINMVEKNSGDQIFILDNKRKFIEANSSNTTFQQELLNEFTKNEGEKKTATGSFQFRAKQDGGYIVTYNKIDSIGLTLLKVQSEKKVYKNISILRNSIIIAALIILVLSIIISIAVSKKLYKPLGKLVKQVESNRNKGFTSESKDEISYLNNMYQYSLDRLNDYDQEKIKYRSIMKVHWLKNFITDGEIDKEQFRSVCAENLIQLTFDSNFVVCVIRIDSLSEFKRTNESKDREIVRFAITNILTELLSDKFSAECVEMGEDQVVAIIQIDQGTQNYLEEISVPVKQTQEILLRHFDVSVTASFGEKAFGVPKLPESYGNALDNSMYRFVLGKRSIITPEAVKENSSNIRNKYSQKLEAKLIENIKLGDVEKVEEYLQEIFREITSFSYNNIVLAAISLVDSVKKAIDDISRVNGKASKFDFVDVKNLIYELETQDEFLELFLTSIKNCMRDPAGSPTDMKYNIISETVVDIITKNYSDPGLCQNQIADSLKTSSRQLARIFKSTTGMSIPDYISDVRLRKAEELLMHSQINVYEIISKIGFDNESYFYRMFKRKYGYTPKEYALLKISDKKE